jgi:photosystem II stability/assembly factor-like uncharacterized protein
MPPRNLQKASQSRVFSFAGPAGPGVPPVYQGLARAHGVNWPLGASTPIRVPSDKRYGDFLTIDRIRAQKGLPTMQLEFRMTRDASDMLKLARNGCEIDIQIHVGSCTDPTDFLAFEKIMVMLGALPSDYTTTELGAFDANQEAIVGETLTFEGLDYFELVPIRDEEVASTEIQQEVVQTIICDSKTCGECGLPSDGCQISFTVEKAHGGSPGSSARVIFTDDAYETVGFTHISTLPSNMDPSGMTCVGTNLVIISSEDNALHYAPIKDILDGVETWTRVATGFVATKTPNAIFSAGRAFTWIVANGGYIYFSSDITAGVTVQTAGSVTAQNLDGIHGTDELNITAVGASNAVLNTNNGGFAWIGYTGPDVGVKLNCIAMRTPFEWFVGADDGTLWYTRDGGVNWGASAFSGSGTGHVLALAFSNTMVGYMAHQTAAPAGRMFRTVDGGNAWYALPEAPGLTLVANEKIGALAACTEEPNLVYGGGLATGGIDGILLKVA